MLGVILHLKYHCERRLFQEQKLNVHDSFGKNGGNLYHSNQYELNLVPKRHTISRIEPILQRNHRTDTFVTVFNDEAEGGTISEEVDYALNKFVNGNLNSINPDMALDEQADMLPYDQKYEFPREKLKIGKKLGMGAFGVVFVATAHGIVPDEAQTIVAVKTVRKMADNEVRITDFFQEKTKNSSKITKFIYDKFCSFKISGYKQSLISLLTFCD